MSDSRKEDARLPDDEIQESVRVLLDDGKRHFAGAFVNLARGRLILGPRQRESLVPRANGRHQRPRAASRDALLGTDRHAGAVESLEDRSRGRRASCPTTRARPVPRSRRHTRRSTLPSVVVTRRDAVVDLSMQVGLTADEQVDLVVAVAHVVPRQRDSSLIADLQIRILRLRPVVSRQAIEMSA